MWLIGNIHSLGEIFYIASDKSLTWNQIYQNIANVLGVESKAWHISSEFLNESSPNYDFFEGLVVNKVNSVVFDNIKVKRIVPCICVTKRFDEGVKETIDFLLKYKEY